MSGYLRFNGSGCAPIDKIASEINTAGDMYHHTEAWHDNDVLEKSCADSIQEALDDAATSFKNIERENAELHKKLKQTEARCGELLIKLLSVY